MRAVNDKDVNTLLACVDPRQERLFRSTFRLVEKFTGGGVPIEDLLEMVPGLYQRLGQHLQEDLLFDRINVGRSLVSGDEADVPVTWEAVQRSGSRKARSTQSFVFRLRRFEEGWRITGIRLPG